MDVKPCRLFTLWSDDDVLDGPLLRMEPGVSMPQKGDMIAAVFKGGAELTIFVDAASDPIELAVASRVTPWATFSFSLRREAEGLRLEWQAHHREIMRDWIERGIKIGGTA